MQTQLQRELWVGYLGSNDRDVTAVALCANVVPALQLSGTDLMPDLL